MSVYQQGIPAGKPVTAKVRPQRKVEITEGAMVEYVGSASAYYHVIMEVAAIRSATAGVALYLKRPGSKPKYGYVVTAMPREVLAVES